MVFASGCFMPWEQDSPGLARVVFRKHVERDGTRSPPVQCRRNQMFVRPICVWQSGVAMKASENQFLRTRAASGTGRASKKQFFISRGFVRGCATTVAFTLVELLAVIAIIAILAPLLLPTFSR